MRTQTTGMSHRLDRAPIQTFAIVILTGRTPTRDRAARRSRAPRTTGLPGTGLAEPARRPTAACEEDIGIRTRRRNSSPRTPTPRAVSPLIPAQAGVRAAEGGRWTATRA